MGVWRQGKPGIGLDLAVVRTRRSVGRLAGLRSTGELSESGRLSGAGAGENVAVQGAVEVVVGGCGAEGGGHAEDRAAVDLPLVVIERAMEAGLVDCQGADAPGGGEVLHDGVAAGRDCRNGLAGGGQDEDGGGVVADDDYALVTEHEFKLVWLGVECGR